LEADDGTSRTLLFGSAAGGETITVSGKEITIVTARSPLGQAVLGKFVNDTFDFKIGPITHTYKVIAVE
jgi:transcription elongation GreA/GreB family factor